MLTTKSEGKISSKIISTGALNMVKLKSVPTKLEELNMRQTLIPSEFKELIHEGTSQ